MNEIWIIGELLAYIKKKHFLLEHPYIFIMIYRNCFERVWPTWCLLSQAVNQTTNQTRDWVDL